MARRLSPYRAWFREWARTQGTLLRASCTYLDPVEEEKGRVKLRWRLYGMPFLAFNVGGACYRGFCFFHVVVEKMPCCSHGVLTPSN